LKKHSLTGGRGDQQWRGPERRQGPEETDGGRISETNGNKKSEPNSNKGSGINSRDIQDLKKSANVFSKALFWASLHSFMGARVPVLASFSVGDERSLKKSLACIKGARENPDLVVRRDLTNNTPWTIHSVTMSLGALTNWEMPGGQGRANMVVITLREVMDLPHSNVVEAEGDSDHGGKSKPHNHSQGQPRLGGRLG
jgi:hypothetical protein